MWLHSNVDVCLFFNPTLKWSMDDCWCQKASKGNTVDNLVGQCLWKSRKYQIYHIQCKMQRRAALFNHCRILHSLCATLGWAWQSRWLGSVTAPHALPDSPLWKRHRCFNKQIGIPHERGLTCTSCKSVWRKILNSLRRNHMVIWQRMKDASMKWMSTLLVLQHVSCVIQQYSLFRFYRVNNLTLFVWPLPTELQGSSKRMSQCSWTKTFKLH